MEREADRGPLLDRHRARQEPEVHQESAAPTSSSAEETLERRD